MNEFKYVRKLAFTVGLGFTLGKLTGKCVDDLASILFKAIVNSTQKKAFEGDIYHQKICEYLGIKYTPNNNTEDAAKMGFHI